VRRCLARRPLLVIPTVLGVSMIIFIAMRLLPGDPLLATFGLEGVRGMTPEQVVPASSRRCSRPSCKARPRGWTSPLPHARREPGRPRKHPKPGEASPKPSPPPLDPRLLDIVQAARYLSVSPWTIRNLEWSGLLPRVWIPLADGRDLRKLLFDRINLDRLIESWRTRE